MRSRSLAVLTTVLCTLILPSVNLAAPTIVPGSGFPAGIDDLEVGSDIYDVTFQFSRGNIWYNTPSMRTFGGDSAGASLAASAIDAVFNASPVPIVGSYNIALGLNNYFVPFLRHGDRDGTWQVTSEGWSSHYLNHQRWALFTWTGIVSPPDDEIPDTPANVIPAPGALLLGGIGAGVLSWLRRRRTI